MLISTIRNNMLTRLQTLLGDEYSQLSFADNISVNKAHKSSKKFSVKPDSAFETSGTTSGITLDHRFEVVLTDTILTPAKSLNDDVKLERSIALQEKAHLIYKDLVTNKSLLSSQILIINNFNMESIEYLDEEKVAVLRFQINIKYKF